MPHKILWLLAAVRKTRAGHAFCFIATVPARDMISPYVDNRPNLTDGPETRYYVAQFLDKDDLVGQLSNVLVVTAPGVI